MLFFHDFEDIKDFVLAVILPPDAETTLLTLDAIRSDVWDYHLDHKRRWQQSHDKTPLPTLPPRHGKAYPLIRYIRRIRRTYTYASAIVLNPDLDFDMGPGTYHINAASIADSPFTGNGQVAIPPLSGFLAKYWRISWNIIVEEGEPEVHVDLGTFYQPLSGISGIDYFTETHNELISDFKIARMNYRSFVDVDVVKKAETPSSTNLVLLVDTTAGGPGSFSDGIIMLQGGGLLGAGYKTDAAGVVPIETGSLFLNVNAGLPYMQNDRLTIFSRADGSKSVSGAVTQYNDDGNDEFKSTRSQVFSGAAFASQSNAPFSSTGGLAFLFPGRNDIRPACLRPFLNAETQRDWRNFGDIWGLEADGEEGYGDGNPLLMASSLTSSEAFNPDVSGFTEFYSTEGTTEVATIEINKITFAGAYLSAVISFEDAP